MRSLLTTNQVRSQGFTLIEMLVIAPLVIITISGFVALMVSMVGDVLVTRDQNNLTYEAQDSLDRIEQDARLSVQFLNTTEALPSPQGVNDGTGAFTNAQNTLILSSVATDENPRSDTRWLIYYANQPYPCGDQETYNRIFLIKVIYYIKNNALWRRVVVPDWNNNSPVDAQTICASAPYTPWQQNTCSPGYTASRCQTEDMKVMDNVQSLDVKYYSDPNSTTEIPKEQATTATTIDVTVNGSKTTAGRPITSSASVRATKINNITAEATPLNAPTVTSSQPSDRPDRAVFSWNDLALATSYNVSYSINGGSWTSTVLDEQTTSYTVTAWRGATVSFKITASNSTYTSSEATDILTLPTWSNLTLQNLWENYANGYANAQFTKTQDGRIFIRGLVRYGTATQNTVIARLPEGYRPEGRLVFQTSTTPNAAARIDIDVDGYIRIYTGANGWIALDGISFMNADAPIAWTNPTWQNGWTSWGNEYEVVRSGIDGTGRVNIQGLARAGTTTSNTIMFAAGGGGVAYRPARTLHFPAGGNGFSLWWVWNTSAEVVKRGAQTSSYMGLQTLYYPGTTGAWSGLTPGNGWANYGGTTYPALEYTKSADGVVTMRGLVQNGAANTVIATLPVGYRPSARQIFTVPSNELYARVDILANGQISFQTGSSSWVALNLSFVVD